MKKPTGDPACRLAALVKASLDEQQPATLAGTVAPGRYTSELQLVLGLPALDELFGLVATAMPEYRLGVYSADALYTVCRAFIKTRRITV